MNVEHVKNRDVMSSLFSVIIPVHNREKYIKDTLRSVVGQEYRPIQLVFQRQKNTSINTNATILKSCTPKRKNLERVLLEIMELLYQKHPI